MNKILVRFGQYFGAASKKPCFLLATNRHHSRHGRTLSSIASSSPIDCYRKGHSNYDVLRSQCSDVEIPQETLPQFLFKNFPAYAERPAIVSTAVQVQPILYLPRCYFHFIAKYVQKKSYPAFQSKVCTLTIINLKKSKKKTNHVFITKS